MKRNILFLALCIIMASCASTTHMTGSWVKPGATNNAYTSVIVLALVGGNHPNLQQDIEEDMVTWLEKKGYKATSYYDTFGAAPLNKTDEQSAVAQLQRCGEDAILTVVLLDSAKEANYTPGSENYTLQPYAYHFYGYYVKRHNIVHDPGYYTPETHYFWEANLYAARSQDLLYSSRTESFDPNSTESLADKYDHTILRDMIEKQVIHPR